MPRRLSGFKHSCAAPPLWQHTIGKIPQQLLESQTKVHSLDRMLRICSPIISKAWQSCSDSVLQAFQWTGSCRSLEAGHQLEAASLASRQAFRLACMSFRVHYSRRSAWTVLMCRQLGNQSGLKRILAGSLVQFQWVTGLL